jgi:hypothetical protein
MFLKKFLNEMPVSVCTAVAGISRIIKYQLVSNRKTLSDKLWFFQFV